MSTKTPGWEEGMWKRTRNTKETQERASILMHLSDNNCVVGVSQTVSLQRGVGFGHCCNNPRYILEKRVGQPKLKTNHKYYYQYKGDWQFLEYY